MVTNDTLLSYKLNKIVEDLKMQTSEAEKDWLRRICGGQPVTEQKKTASVKEAEHKPESETKAKGHGFGEIAGMNGLK